jgi:hypothetical protein
MANESSSRQGDVITGRFRRGPNRLVFQWSILETEKDRTMGREPEPQQPEQSCSCSQLQFAEPSRKGSIVKCLLVPAHFS